MLPVIAKSGPAMWATMTTAPMVFSAIMAIMTVEVMLLYAVQVAEIKGEPFRLPFVIDPSGYVYDAYTMERIEGVKTTVYCVLYDESEAFWSSPPGDDVYGTLWNAAEYDQLNPLYTNADGTYAWDVPEGWWRVKYEKAGYETTWSDWLPVPPPQTEVNIGLTPIDTSDYRFGLGKMTDTSASATVTNTTQSAITAVFVLAAYDAHGKLLEMQSVTDQLTAQESTTLTVSCGSSDTIAKVKGFVLDAKSYAPLESVWIRAIS